MIVALGVILTGLVAAMTLALSNLSASELGQTRVVAYNLAREGVEVARNIRDSNWLDGKKDWNDGLFTSGGDNTAIAVFNLDENTWSFNFLPNNFEDKCEGEHLCAKLYYDKDNQGVYIEDTNLPPGAPTIYKRLISFDKICLNRGVEITGGDFCGEQIGVRVRSEVKWLESGRAHSFSVEENLYNWR